MKIVLYGATGHAGHAILSELLTRGHEVVAVSRKPEGLPSTIKTVEDNLSDSTCIAQIIKGADAVVSAYAPPRDDTDQLKVVTQNLIDAVRRSGVPRLIVVGGCGSLEYEPGILVVDSGYWPKQYIPVARSHMKALAALKASDINWTYFSPPMSITSGLRTGEFRLGLDQLIKDKNGKSHISFEDYAVAMVDELEQPKHERMRVTVGY